MALCRDRRGGAHVVQEVTTMEPKETTLYDVVTQVAVLTNEVAWLRRLGILIATGVVTDVGLRIVSLLGGRL